MSVMIDTNLTPRQREMLCWTFSCMLEGRAPTIRELGAAFGIASPNGVMCHLKAMAAKGYLRLHGGKARGLSLVGLRLAPLFSGSEAGGRLREAVRWREQAQDAGTGAGAPGAEG